MILRGQSPPLPPALAEINTFIRNGGKDTKTRDEAIHLVEESFNDILCALDTVTPERLQSIPDNPVGPLPFTVWMQVPSEHMKGHRHQLAYLQTIWGDLEDHA